MPDNEDSAPRERLEEVLRAVRRLKASERSSYLDRACAGRPDLRAQVEARLAERDPVSGARRGEGRGGRNEPARDAASGPEAAQLVSPPTVTMDSSGSRPVSSPAGLPDQVGRYEILEKLGEGGMGIVYKAKQTSPRREVALKIIKGGRFVDEAVLQMFRRETDTLARLEHPNIARIYEVGRTELSQHFFAMELVHGKTLAHHLANSPERLTGEEVERRLRLFCEIAHAVAYAHLRGVIHRDLKPGNVVVTKREDDEKGVTVDTLPPVKVLDFGLADVVEGEESGSEKESEERGFRGTPEYTSPEQARGDPDVIDLRTDVYSLGVMLYEMLTGRRPYEIDRSDRAGMVRTICETPPAPLREEWRGERKLDPDLEIIVAKALEKDPVDRYESAAALARDVDRYLKSQPIFARPWSTTYQVRKLVARNKLGAGSLLVVVVGSLIAGLVMFHLGREAKARAAELNASSIVAHVRNARDPALGVRLAAELSDDLEPPNGIRNLRAFIDGTAIPRAVLRTRAPAVEAGAFDREGSLATGAYDGNRTSWVETWDPDQPRAPEHTEELRGRISSVSFDPQGEGLVIAYGGTTPRFWSPGGEGERQLENGGQEQVWDARFSPDGTRIVAASTGGMAMTARIWRRDGDLIWRLPDLKSVVMGVDGSRLLTVENGVATVRSVEDGEPTRQPLDHPGMVERAIFSPRGDRVLTAGLTAGKRDAWIWPVAGGPGRQLEGHGQEILAAAFSPPDGTLLVTGSEDGTEIWSVETGTPEAVMEHGAAVRSVVFSADGTLIVTGSSDGLGRVWAVDEPSEPRLVLRGHGDGDLRVLFDPVSATIATLGSDGTVRLWASQGGTEPIALRGHDSDVTGVAFSDGDQIVTRSAGGVVRRWAASDGRELRGEAPAELAPALQTVADGLQRVADSAEVRSVTRDGETLLSYRDPSLRLEDADGQVLHEVKAKDVPECDEFRSTGAALSPEGDLAFVGCQNGGVALWRPRERTARLASTLDEPVDVVAVSPASLEDGRLVATADKTGTVEVWRWTEDELQGPIDELRHPQSDVAAGAFRPDGKRLVTASGRVARVWRIGWGELLAFVADAAPAQPCLDEQQRIEYLGETRPQARQRAQACEKG